MLKNILRKPVQATNNTSELFEISRRKEMLFATSNYKEKFNVLWQ
jgi:hypothetical protein